MLKIRIPKKIVMLTVGFVLGLARSAAAWEETEAAGEATPDSLLSIVFSGGWVGVTIMLILFALSITAMYLVIEHAMSIRRAVILPEGLGEHVRQQLLAGRPVEAESACRAQPSLLSFVLLQGLGEIEGGWSAVEKATEEALAEQSAHLMRRIEYLAVISNLAPMLGLLGTVTGMIMAFREVAVSQGSAGAAELAQGIYSALVTTVAGLVVAIPGLGAFAVFRNRVDQFVAEAAYAAQHAFMPLKRRRSPAKPVAPPAPPK